MVAVTLRVDRNYLNNINPTPPRWVALLTEGVDRNVLASIMARMASRVALLTEGVDRNSHVVERLVQAVKSPSSRRAWIEIW